MSGDHPRDTATVQEELNRQALVAFGKRLTVLEDKLVTLEEDIKDLHYFSASSLETAKRLQGLVKGLVDQKKWEEAKRPSRDDGEME